MSRRHPVDIKLTLEITTPAFLGGAEPRRVDRYLPVRPSAVRGALRSWFRTAAAALMPATGLRAQSEVVQNLYEAEARVFGSTERRSAVSVSPPVGPDARHIKKYGKELPDNRQWPGLRYLGYGAFGSKDGVHFIEPPARFDLVLRAPRPFDGLLELLSATVWLWIHLGGLGARVRRGFGSLRLCQYDGLICPDSHLRTASSPEAVSEHLSEGVAWALDVFRSSLPLLGPSAIAGDGRETHPRLRTLDDLSDFVVLPPYATAEEALEQAGRLFRDFRSTLRRRDLGLQPLPDYFAVKEAVARRETPRMAERAAFGLPLRYFFRSLHEKSTWVLSREPRERKRYERLASPLHFRVHPVGDASRHVAVLFHMARNKGPMAGLELVQRNPPGRIPSPGSDILEQFMEWARNQARRLPTGTKS